jgi:hypothetical protein
MKKHLLAAALLLPIMQPAAPAQLCDPGIFLGRPSANPYDPDSTSNPLGPFGNPFAAASIHNPLGPFGSPVAPTSVANPLATHAPRIIAADGQYLGRLSANPHDPDSISNPYGRYGSPYSPTSIHNPYSKYGSPYSPLSPNNPFATQAPTLCSDEE